MHDVTLNPIERCFRTLVAQGRAPLKLFAANPNDEGIAFPGAILAECYNKYFQQQEYRPEAKGLWVAREAISQYYRAQDAAIDPEQILLTAGTSESFFYLFSLLAQPGDNIVTPTPSYPLFDEIARRAYVTLRPYRLDEAEVWAIDLASVRRGIDTHTRAIVIVSPHNPTGMVADTASLRGLADMANAHGIPLICDEVFAEFYFGNGPFPRAMQVSQPELCFTLGGISKMFALPAMKLAWVAVTGDSGRVATAVDQLETMNDTFLSCHYPIQEALPEIFARGGAFLCEYRAEVTRRRAIAMEILHACPSLRFHPSRGGFYLMVRLLNARWLDDEACVCELMERHGIFPHPGHFYDYEEGIHLVISTLLSPERLTSGLTRLCSAIS